MNLSSVSINRPVLASVFSIVILLFGFIGFNSLGIREYPSVDPPIVSVSTSYTGANSAVIEAQITEPLEASINGIAGIKSITSSSSDGRSRISIEFELGVDMEDAANDVRDRVSRAVRRLPPDADAPVVTKADADAENILTITMQSDKRDLLEISDIATNVIKERIQTVSDVSEVSIWGEKRYAMRLYLDPKKLASFNVTPVDIRKALSLENVELPTGKIEGYFTELSIRTLGRLETPEEFNNLIIKYDRGVPIKLRDIGNAQYAPENERNIMRGNGMVPMVGIAVIPQPGANYISIADEVYSRVEAMQRDLPEDIKLSYAYDITTNIRKAITEVKETIMMSFILVVLVIFIFLRNWRTTIIPIIAIPISLFGSFFVMYLAGFSINVLSLLGIVLATGLVVDDAIVVMENIYSKIELGYDRYKAGYAGSKEIFFAVISTTITLVVVFMPIVFLSGVTGRLFREFGVVVAGAVVLSTFVSLTLTPMMSTQLLRKSKKETRVMAAIGRGIQWLSDAYGNSLTRFMQHRWLSLLIMGISVVIIFFSGVRIQSELAPMEDKSRLSITATAPEGIAFEAMDTYMLKLGTYLDSFPEKVAMVMNTSPGWLGSNGGSVQMQLLSPLEREKSQSDLAVEINKFLKKQTFARAYVTQDQTIKAGGGGGGLPVQFVVQATNFDKLKEVVPEFLATAQADPRFQIVDVNLKFNKPEIVVEIDRDKARASGIAVQDIAEALQLYFSGQRYGYFIRNGKQYYVIGQAERGYRDDPNDLKGIYLRANNGGLVELGSVIKTTEQSIPPTRYRYNRYVSATFRAAPAAGYTLGQGIEAMREIADKTLDDTFQTTLTGASQQFEESSNSLVLAFLLALVLVYLVLAAQFESFRDPLIIMFTVPLALAGALLSLWMFGHTLNIFSEIGIIVLIGIVTKNGILIVEFANQKKEDGMSKEEAVIYSSRQRLRPILMTSLATIFGALPIALALGAASTSRIPMGITIIGGLIFSLILTLYVIPALYSYISTRKPNVIRTEYE